MYIYFMTPDYRALFKPVFIYACLAVFTVAVFYPALNSGIFLLDDYINLRNLTQVAGNGVFSFIISGESGPGGRPLSLLTFALQYNSWPAEPYAFKLVNLLIHIMNGALVFFISSRLIGRLEAVEDRYNQIFSLLVAGLWLLHPVQLSSVLYVIQRMNLLSGLFILLGISSYLIYRDRIMKKGTGKLILVALVYSCTILSILCKENGVLLPLYILCIEFIVYPEDKELTAWRRYIIPVLLVPLFTGGLYLILNVESITAGFAYRGYSVQQRLITEAGILLEYMKIILIPNPNAFSLYHDDYAVAAGLFGNIGTVVNITILGLMIIAGFFLRNRFRIFTFAIFWFLAGHILESGFMPLELYFEHRNYIPSYGVILFISILLIKGVIYIRNKPARVVLFALYPVLILTVTIIELDLWKNPYLQAEEWALNHPQSRRAQVNLWNVSIMSNNREKAIEVKRKLQDIYPDDIFPEIKELTTAYCFNNGAVDDDEWSRIIQSAAVSSPVGNDAIDELNYIIVEISQKRCSFSGDLPLFRELLYTLIQNDNFKSWMGILYEYAATVSVLMEDGAGALDNIREAVKISPTVENRIYMARILTASGMKDEALRLENEIRENSFLNLKVYQELKKLNRMLDNKQIHNRQ